MQIVYGFFMANVRVLVSDPLAEEGLGILKKAFEVDVKTDLKEDELCRIIGDYDALLVRSSTEVTAKVIEAGKRLRFIGRAGVGVDNIDMDAATRKGIIVANAPEGNTLAATEHTMAMMLSLARNIPQATQREGARHCRIRAYRARAGKTGDRDGHEMCGLRPVHLQRAGCSAWCRDDVG